jgi:hypothetical protein
MKDDVGKLELRIQELENQLKAISGPTIDPKDMEIFKKVAGQLGFDPDSVCGINECKIAVCKAFKVCVLPPTVCKVCRPCIYECICGPCSIYSSNIEGYSRFNDLGM